jgi:alkaline phosphatase
MPGWDAEKKKPVAKFSTGDHTGIPVPVFAYGPGAEDFAGHYLNTDIYFKILKARSIVP